MTDADWLSCVDPEQMLDALTALGHAIDRDAGRRLRLFAADCWRRVCEVDPDETSRGAADGQERAARGDAPDPSAALMEAGVSSVKAAVRLAELQPTETRAREVFMNERQRQCDSLRALLGNPFVAVVVLPMAVRQRV